MGLGWPCLTCSRHAASALILLLLAALLCPLPAIAQFSSAVAHDSNMDVSTNKFLQRQADLDKDDSDVFTDDEIPMPNICPQNIELKWMSEVSSSIYATPLITDLYSDGRKDIIVPSFVHYLEVLEGPEGGSALGWPAFHKSTVHASPLMYDIDFDGVRDILLATYDGEILFFKDTGEILPERIFVSRLSVRKEWYVGLNPDPIDHSKPDVGDGDKANATATTIQSKSQPAASPPRTAPSTLSPPMGDANKAADTQPQAIKSTSAPATLTKVEKFVKQITEYRAKYGEEAATKLLDEAKGVDEEFYQGVMAALKSLPPAGVADLSAAGSISTGNKDGGSGSEPNKAPAADLGSNRSHRRLLLEDDGADPHRETDLDGDAAYGSLAGGKHRRHQRVHQTRRKLEDRDGARDVAAGSGGVETDGKHKLSSEAADSFEVFADDDEPLPADTNDYNQAQKLDAFLERAEYDEFGDQIVGKGDADGDDLESLHKDDDLGDAFDREHYQHMYTGDYATRAHKDGAGWQDEDFEQSAHQMGDKTVDIDPHIICTPAIGDLDGDNHDELVVAISFFFDREYYDVPEHAEELKDVDIGKYVASGVAAFDLRTRQLKWMQHLDLSTDATTFKAYAYSSPVLVDLNGDGALEIILGGSMGFLYVLDQHGTPLPGWPVQMGEIQGPALVADLNNDGKLEIFAADTRGNLAMFNVAGEELWERHVHSLVAAGAIAADINNDGELEIILATSNGYVYALSGSNGQDVGNFPFRTHGRIPSQPTVTRLGTGPSQQVLVTAFDGFLYVIDGISGCADTVDLGETSYTAVLVDDLDNNGRLDLLVTTMNGNVYCFETPAQYHPLKTWPSQLLGPNGQVARHDYVGVFADPASRRARDVAGEKLPLRVTIMDKRQVFAANGSLVPYPGGPYNVSVVLKGVGVSEMNSGEAPVIGIADTFSGPGTYSLELPCPRSRASATVRLEMTDKSGLLFSDEFALSFHLHFHKLLKWLVALPLVGMVAALVAMQGRGGVEGAAGPALPLYGAGGPRDSHQA